MMISVVIPIFNEEVLVDELHRRVSETLRTLGQPHEIIYVNDGSHDRTLNLLLEYQAKDPHIVIVSLTRNWGHQAAVTAGLSEATGDAVVLMDGDLQDPPEVIPNMLNAWQQGNEVVVAVRTGRREAGLRRFMFPLFYKMLGWLSDFPLPLNAGIFGLLDRRAADAIRNLNESNRYLPGLRSWIGFRTTTVHYHREERAGGQPKQTFVKLFKYALDAIFSFSYKPLRITLALGLITSIGAFSLAVILLICRVFNVGLFAQPVTAGYTSTILSVLFLGGVQLIGLGILGEYIGRIYDEVKRRPLFLIDRVHRSDASAQIKKRAS
jgi:polyisoprenyl-phosphate glycosyltransferase